MKNEPYFTEIKPYTHEEMAKLHKDYDFAVKYLACNIPFEEYLTLVMLDKLIKGDI